uniref:Uncharacterized protein n=1 Tax=Amphimedon queenslandica TaxID=400682 RepID=A0A1X7UHN3_AMPQE
SERERMQTEKRLRRGGVVSLYRYHQLDPT